MAQKKGGGSTRNGRDSQPKMLGVKAYGGEMVTAGSFIVARIAAASSGRGRRMRIALEFTAAIVRASSR